MLVARQILRIFLLHTEAFYGEIGRSKTWNQSSGRYPK